MHSGQTLLILHEIKSSMYSRDLDQSRVFKPNVSRAGSPVFYKEKKKHLRQLP